MYLAFLGAHFSIHSVQLGRISRVKENIYASKHELRCNLDNDF